MYQVYRLYKEVFWEYALQSKYATTFMDIENEIHETEKQLVKMIDELDGSEYDLKGLGELKALLMGD